MAVTKVPVELGAVLGFKYVHCIPELGSKQVRYSLRVPGGYACAVVLKKGLKWEESQLEQWLATIQVIAPIDPIA
jgi:hypothetical protein